MIYNIYVHSCLLHCEYETFKASQVEMFGLCFL